MSKLQRKDRLPYTSKNLMRMLTLNNGLTERQTADQILACNEKTAQYGLVLREQQAAALAKTRTMALRETKRLELNGGIVDKLILAFCDSPYITKENYEETLHELVSLFYDLKNDTWDAVSDDDCISFLKRAFNGRCCGSLELLADEAIKLAGHIHCGGTLKTFKEDAHGNT